MGNTVPDNKNIHPYSEIWRALPPIRTHTGRQKLPSSFFTLWETLLPIMSRGVHEPRDRYWLRWSRNIVKVWYVSWSYRKDQSSVSYVKSSGAARVPEEVPDSFAFGTCPSVVMYTSVSRCCFCQFDSITVIIMEGTAPDNYTSFFL